MSVWPLGEPWAALFVGSEPMKIRVAPGGHWAELGCTSSLRVPRAAL